MSAGFHPLVRWFYPLCAGVHPEILIFSPRLPHAYMGLPQAGVAGLGQGCTCQGEGGRAGRRRARARAEAWRGHDIGTACRAARRASRWVRCGRAAGGGGRTLVLRAGQGKSPPGGSRLAPAGMSPPRARAPRLATAGGCFCCRRTRAPRAPRAGPPHLQAETRVDGAPATSSRPQTDSQVVGPGSWLGRMVVGTMPLGSSPND